jgi:hypothetical protein
MDLKAAISLLSSEKQAPTDQKESILSDQMDKDKNKTPEKEVSEEKD